MLPRSLGLAVLGIALVGALAFGAALRPELSSRPEPVETTQTKLGDVRTPSAAPGETRRALLLRSDDPARGQTALEPAAESRRTTLILWLLALSVAAGSLTAGYTRITLLAKTREKRGPVSQTRS